MGDFNALLKITERIDQTNKPKTEYGESQQNTSQVS